MVIIGKPHPCSYSSCQLCGTFGGDLRTVRLLARDNDYSREVETCLCGACRKDYRDGLI